MSFDEQPDPDPHGECAAQIARLPKTCRIHEDVPYIERESGSVHGGTIGWGCAVCNMLKLEEARRRIAQLEAALRKIEKFSGGLDPDDNARIGRC